MKVFRGRRAVLIMLGLMVALVAISHWPVTTRFGINYQWSSQQLPLYEKAVHFLSRDLQTRRMVHDIVAGISDDEEKLVRIFSWVTTHIRSVPEGFPIVDDHPLHILIRGYGPGDQRTEAFVLLAGYAGFQAGLAKLTPLGRSDHFLIVALVDMGPRTFVFDVANRTLFKNRTGGLADTQQLLAHPEWIGAAAPGRIVQGLPYEQYFSGLQRRPSRFSRTDDQQPWPRLSREAARLLRRGLRATTRGVSERRHD
ncbi:MAG: hypothetical protein Q8R91_03030 [Candidatus Omnitrophota bacterium]|nr:hypothetical protein [Candidatus Omnitrophota bacterium]